MEQHLGLRPAKQHATGPRRSKRRRSQARSVFYALSRFHGVRSTARIIGTVRPVTRAISLDRKLAFADAIVSAKRAGIDEVAGGRVEQSLAVLISHRSSLRLKRRNSEIIAAWTVQEPSSGPAPASAPRNAVGLYR
jgi:hypothetical protein